MSNESTGYPWIVEYSYTGALWTLFAYGYSREEVVALVRGRVVKWSVPANAKFRISHEGKSEDFNPFLPPAETDVSQGIEGDVKEIREIVQAMAVKMGLREKGYDGKYAKEAIDTLKCQQLGYVLMKSGYKQGDDEHPVDAAIKIIENGKEPTRVWTPAEFQVEVRRAVAKYIKSEGCSCCRGESHGEDEERLATLLEIPKYEDGSGYNWGKVL